jgi:hypothetical protein
MMPYEQLYCCTAGDSNMFVEASTPQAELQWLAALAAAALHQ